MDDPRTINAILAKLDETYLSEHALAAPTEYWLAVSVVCDIKCPYCPRQVFPREKVNSGFMKPQFWEPVTPWLRYANSTNLFGLGEPFLYKKFFEWHAQAKAQGTATSTTTHGMSLTEELTRKLIEAQLDELVVSMDGCSPETFNFLREGADFHTVCQNVRRLVRLREELASKRPALQITCAISKHNLHEMIGMVWLAKRLGAVTLAFSNLIAFRPQDAPLCVTKTRRFKLNLALAQRLGALIGLKVLFTYQKELPWQAEENLHPKNQPYGCPLAWRTVVVERDGATKPCCYLEEPTGNSAASADFSDNFNNPKSLELRRSILQGALNKNCQECGMLTAVNNAHHQRCLAEAREMISRADLSQAARQQLDQHLQRYEELARQRERSIHNVRDTAPANA